MIGKTGHTLYLFSLLGKKTSFDYKKLKKLIGTCIQSCTVQVAFDSAIVKFISSCASEFFAVNTKLPEMAILVSKDLAAAKKVTSVGFNLKRLLLV